MRHDPELLPAQRGGTQRATRPTQAGAAAQSARPAPGPVIADVATLRQLQGAAGNAAVAQRLGTGYETADPGLDLLAHRSALGGTSDRTAAALQRLPVVQRGKFSQHATERGAQRGISNTKMREVMRTGARYSDANYEGAIVYYDAATQWAVITQEGQVITTYQTPAPKARWTRR